MKTLGRLSNCLLTALFFALSIVTVWSQEIVPVKPESFFITPNEEHTLEWKLNGENKKISDNFRIFNYSGSQIAEGKPEWIDSTLTVKVKLPRGYYDVEVHGKRFGIVSMEAFVGKTDPFFGMDAVLNWLDRRQAARESLVLDMKRIGIAMPRERINWSAMEKKEGEWDWNAHDQSEALRAIYTKEGMKVLEMFHSAGPARGSFPVRSLYPQDLRILSRSWPTLYEKFKSTWGALEVWNEPEGSGYGSGLPADQYMVVVKGMRYAWEKHGIKSPLGGGVLMGGDPGVFHRFCVLNGMLEDADFVSIHDYKPATKTERLVKVHRAWLKEGGKEGMPLWLTEAGWFWPIGGGRPAIPPDQESAMQIVMKGVEAKACGIATYMPFCLAFYEESGTKSFSMMGKDLTPLRSMAAYAQSIRLLAGKEYAGDLQTTDPAILRARVFKGNTNEMVAVIYTDVIKEGQKVSLPMKANAVEGMDGRPLKQVEDGKIEIPDGIAYVKFEQGPVAKETEAMALLNSSKQPFRNSPSKSPIILQYLPTPGKVSYSSTRYIVNRDTLSAFPVRVRVHNLSDQPQKASLKLALPGETQIPSERLKVVEVPALSVIEEEWIVDVRNRWKTPEPQPITIAAVSDSGQQARTLAIPMQTAGELEEYLASYAHKEVLEIGDPALWRNNISGGGIMKLEALVPRGLKMQYTFKGGDRWSYPQFNVGPGKLAGASGFLLRIRASEPAEVRMAISGPTMGTCLTFDSIIPSDNQWHVVFVPLSQFEPNQDMRNKNLGGWKPEDVSKISVGLNDRSKTSSNTLEVSDLLIVGPAR